MADFKLIQQKVHETTTSKGFHDPKNIDIEAMKKTAVIMLVVTELSEAVESIRNKEPDIWQRSEKDPVNVKVLPTSPDWNPKIKPEGVLTELADAVIRVMDYCEENGLDLENAIRIKNVYNMSRPILHGGKAL